MQHTAFALAVAVAMGAAVATATIAGDVSASTCPTMPVVTLPMAQVVPENPGLNSQRLWQLAVCDPVAYSRCMIPAAFVTEIDADGAGCDVGFTAASGTWSPKFGGMNTLFTGSAGAPNNRFANVTLVCDATASTPVGDGPVVVHSSNAGNDWHYAIRVKTSVVCPATPSPAPTAAPATSVTLEWSVDVAIGNAGYSPAMIVTDGTLIAQTVNAISGVSTVTGIDPGTGQLFFQNNDGSNGQGRSGLGEGHGTGLFFQEVNQPFPLSPSVLAYDTNGNMQWNFSSFMTWTGVPNPYAFKGNVYAGAEIMFIINAIGGNQVTNRGSPSAFAESTPAGYSVTDRHGVTTDVIIYDWVTPTIAFNVTDPSNPTQLWNYSKIMPGGGFLSNIPRVTPDQKTVFMQTTGANVTSEGLWIGAFDSMTGTLEAGFGAINVEWGTSPFAVSNAALFAVKSVGASSTISVIAYSRADASVLWHVQLAASSVSDTCSYETSNETIVCTVNTASSQGRPTGTQLFKIDASTGAILWQHSFPASEGSVYGWAPYKPIIVAKDALIVLWQNPANATNPNPGYALRRLKLVDHAAPTPPPATPPLASSIAVAHFPAAGCAAGTGTTQYFRDGSCTADSASESTLRFCVGPTLHVQTFASSATCGGTPSATAELHASVCYPQPIAGGSVEVTRCA